MLGKTFKSVAYKKDLGKMLVAARKAQGLSQGDVAKSMGATQSFIAKAENTYHSPNLDTIKRYSEAIGGELEISIIIHE